MFFQIIVQPEARLDIQEGIDYYKSISVSLGKKFLEQVNNTFCELEQFPFYEIRYDNIRMRKIKVFPYVVHFLIEEEVKIVRIFGVRLGLREPESAWFFQEEEGSY